MPPAVSHPPDLAIRRAAVDLRQPCANAYHAVQLGGIDPRTKYVTKIVQSSLRHFPGAPRSKRKFFYRGLDLFSMIKKTRDRSDVWASRSIHLLFRSVMDFGGTNFWTPTVPSVGLVEGESWLAETVQIPGPDPKSPKWCCTFMHRSWSSEGVRDTNFNRF